MESLQTFFEQQHSSDIHAIGRYIQQHVDEQWQLIFEANKAEMLRRFPEIGDTVYGIYGTRMFKHIHDQFSEVGLRATPRLPGSFPISREWGEDEMDRQRWMWSKITRKDGTNVGTIVTVFFHEHEQIRIPRPFQIIALEETSKGAVVEALSRRSLDFKNAQEAKIEIAQYMAQVAGH
ncbi:MAG: hypothetical protein H0X30_07790 [Anaerolineae bacterium]|nr:hypothetical protein [Anaerolineae bacterium]